MSILDKNDTPLDTAITRAIRRLGEMEPSSEEYAQTVEQISKLHALKINEDSRRLSPDTLLLVGANLAGILLIIGYENTNVITSKAMSFVMKPR